MSELYTAKQALEAANKVLEEQKNAQPLIVAKLVKNILTKIKLIAEAGRLTALFHNSEFYDQSPSEDEVIEDAVKDKLKELGYTVTKEEFKTIGVSWK